MTKHAIFIALLAACTPDAPATPSFQQDVMPILAANCVRCHGYPTLVGPALMRLDVYGDVAVDDTTSYSGAGVYASLIADRVASSDQPMPPRFPLDDFQIETLQNWADGASAGDAPPRGQPRPDNRRPDIVAQRTSQAGTVVGIQSAIQDDDGDLVAGELRVRVGAAERVAGPVRSGLVEVRWDSTGVPPGDYPLAAHLDDGAQVHVINLGTITVEGP